MVIDNARDGNDATIFSVFAARARQRSSTSLLEQTVACAFAGILLVMLVPAWWPVASALGAGAAYAMWGLVDRAPRSRITSAGLRGLATLAAVFAFAAIVGVGLAAFTGDAPSPKGTCYEANGRAFPCDARGKRRAL
jgi:hypothetical protein